MEKREIRAIDDAMLRTRSILEARKTGYRSKMVHKEGNQGTLGDDVLLKAKQLVISLHVEELTHAMGSKVSGVIASAVEKSSEVLKGHPQLHQANVMLMEAQMRECMESVSKEMWWNDSVKRSSLASLRKLVQSGKLLCVDTALISSLEQLGSDAELCCGWTCGVCLDVSQDAFPPSCCGRDDSSNLLCKGCLDTLIKMGAKCPFCRARRLQ